MSDVLLSERQGRVAIFTLNRPDHLNAVGTQTLRALGDALSDVEGDDEVGAVVVAGQGKAFSAGADISELAKCDGPLGFAAFVHRFTDTYDRLQRLGKPSIAAVDGVALGGGFELALACDLRVASRRAHFGVPEIKLGLLPAAGGSQRLARMLPVAVAKQLLLTGQPLGAEAAHRLGLVNEVVEDGDALDAAVRLASSLAELPPLALAAAKRLVDDGGGLPLDAGVTLERETVSVLFATEDGAEGISAFLEKRPAEFHGR